MLDVNCACTDFVCADYSVRMRSFMNEFQNLSNIKPGDYAKVQELLVDGAMRRRLLDIGLIKNTRIECLGRSPAGDPTAFLIRGAVIAIRSEDCENILIKNIEKGTLFDGEQS